MFFPGSRYEKTGTYVVTLADRSTALVVRLPQPRPAALIGYHPRIEGDRLDLLAARYLADPTTFWRLCDADDAVVPGALEARSLIGIPGPRS
jgi:hypothetical protein